MGNDVYIARAVQWDAH